MSKKKIIIGIFVILILLSFVWGSGRYYSCMAFVSPFKGKERAEHICLSYCCNAGEDGTHHHYMTEEEIEENMTDEQYERWKNRFNN